MFDLKVDENFPHHYIIGVACHPMTSSKVGEIYLKYGPVYFTNDDVVRMRDSAQLTGDRIYKDIYGMTNSEILEMNNCSELAFTIIGIKIAASTNQATLHHFSTEEEIPHADKFFDNFVKTANNFKEERMKLIAAEIRY